MEDANEELRLRMRAFLRTTTWNQHEFAIEADVSPRTVAGLSRGEHVSAESRAKIGEALDRLEPLTDTGEATGIAKIARLEDRVARLEAALRDRDAALSEVREAVARIESAYDGRDP